MTTKTRLLEFIRYKSLSQSRFEKACGLSNGYVNNIRLSITPDKLQKIARCFPELDTGWLLTGEGQMLKGVAAGVAPANQGVPYFDFDIINSYQDVLKKNPDYHIDFKPYNSSDLWINVIGHSMAPIVNNGDIIAVKRIENWRKFLLYGEIYAIFTNEFRAIRIIARGNDSESFKLIPINQDSIYCEQSIPKSSVIDIFAVCCSLKRLR